MSGAVEPDTYVVAKEGPRLLEARTGNQEFMIVRGHDGHDQRVDLAPGAVGQRVLTDDEVLELARLAMQVEDHFGQPQDVEWAIERGRTFVVQARPVTTLGVAAASSSGVPDGTGRPLLTGLAAAPGVATGRVRILRDAADGTALLPGEILVAPMTSPDWVPTMRRAAALVTDGGGVTCHAAIVSRELRLPCIVGTRQGTRVLRDGEVVTVDGGAGSVYEGDVAASLSPPPTAARADVAPDASSSAPEPLGTRVYVNLAMPEAAEAAAALPVDGVGLLRAEFMLTEALGGEHPRRLLARRWTRRVPRPDVRRRCCGSRERSRPVRSCTARSTSASNEFRNLDRGRGVRTRRGQPDDRVPGLLPLRAGARPVHPGARSCWPGCARRRRTCT